METLAIGKYDEVLLVISALAEEYGWHARMAEIISALVMERQKMEKLVEKALAGATNTPL